MLLGHGHARVAQPRVNSDDDATTHASQANQHTDGALSEMARSKNPRRVQPQRQTTGSMTHLLAWPVRMHPTDATRKPTKITEPLCPIPAAWPARTFRFIAFSGDVQKPPSEVEWNKCTLAARCIVVETIKAVQFTNGTQDDMSIFDLPQVVGILTDKMLGYMAALVFRVRSAMDSYKMLDRMIVYQRAYEHLILLCKTNSEARVQVVPGSDFYEADIIQVWTRAFAEMLEICPASCVSFLCDFVLRNELSALRDFSAVCLSALLVKHPHWFANDIVSGRFASCYERHELTRQDLERMSARMAEMVANPQPEPDSASPQEQQSPPEPAASPSADQEEEEEAPAEAPYVHAPHVDTVLTLCRTRGCPCVRKCVSGSDDAPAAASALIASIRHDTSDVQQREAVETKIREALSSPVAKMLPFDVLQAAFPVSFLDKSSWEAIKSVSTTGAAASFAEEESSCLLVDGVCANWQTLAKALGIKE